MTVLTEPKKSFEEFCQWYSKEPAWHKIQIETVTCRDMGEKMKGLINSKAQLIDIYNVWYLPRLF